MLRILLIISAIVFLFSCGDENSVNTQNEDPTTQDTISVFYLKNLIADGDTLLCRVDSKIVDTNTLSEYNDFDITLLPNIEEYCFNVYSNEAIEFVQATLQVEYCDTLYTVTSVYGSSENIQIKFNISNLDFLNLLSDIYYNLKYIISINNDENDVRTVEMPLFKTRISGILYEFEKQIPELYPAVLLEDSLYVEKVSNHFDNNAHKLNFIQFHGKNCINSMVETKELQLFFESEEFDTEKCNISTFFSSPDSLGSVSLYIFNVLNGSLIMAGVKPTFDTYFDGIDEVNNYSQEVKKYFNIIENDVIAIFPNGEIRTFPLGEDFSEWIKSQYYEFIGNKKINIAK
ncbi:MAG: hypothetical protein JXR48_15125 [Candidatus Delongbacteria bacterium]|nr:hypothetical protein [Candidatus Delongbacteria bacterium]MBN2836289.1 hypothetical protein [Candidatus Delongbacteria bacterium]